MEIPVFVIIILILVAIGLAVAAFVAGIQYRKKVGEAQIGAAETKAREIIDDALRSADSKNEKFCWKLRKKLLKRKMKWNMK